MESRTQFIGHIRPGRFDRERNFDFFVHEKIEFLSNDERRRVGETQEPELEGHDCDPSLFFASSSAATAAIRLFSFIALRRSHR